MALAPRKSRNSYFARLTRLKKLFWLYFFLLIFEGALRKWVAPQFSGPLLIIRDPVALLIIWEAFRTNKWPQRWATLMSGLTVLMVGLFVLQITAGDNPLLVGLYGLRSYLLPFPVLFIMGENLDEEDLLKITRWTLWLLVPMTLLQVAQYVSPSSSFLNNGAYEGARQIGFVAGHVRASGTFSFAVGSISFGSMAATFIVYGMVKEGLAPKWLLWACAFALILSVPMTGSRGFVYQLAGLVAFVGLCAMMGISQFGKVLQIILPIVIVSFLASLLPVYTDASQNLVDRFANASKGGEGDPLQTVVHRMITPIFEEFESSDFGSNWMGEGLGRGANAVSAMLTGRAATVFGEGEFGREMGEMGWLGGTAFAVFKLLLAIMIFGQALARAREGESLALLFVPLAVTGLLFATPEQPTEQGFMVIAMAFCIAAARVRVQTMKQAPPLAIRPQRVLYRSHLQRR